jgi:hypothetical protein
VQGARWPGLNRVLRPYVCGLRPLRQPADAANVAMVAVPERIDGKRQRRRRLRPRPPGTDALVNLVRPFRNTGRYYLQSWRDYLGATPEDLPVARPTPALAVQAFSDELVLLGLLARRPVSEAGAFKRITGEVIDALEFYGREGYFKEPQRFFEPPPPLREVTVRAVKSRSRSYHRLVFDSGYQPYVGEPGRDRWLGYDCNNREYALMLHDQPRPWLVCVHGTEMGRAAVDLAVFRARQLHEQLGLNVVMPVLPMHGPRARGLPKGAVFPGEDVLDNVHATAQAVWDIRRLLSWIREQEPRSRIGLNGLSLGGYIAALVASLEDGLACAILGVPVADLIDILACHVALSRDDPRRQTFDLAAPIGRMISPLSLAPRVPMRGRFIYAGVADRLVHPREQTVLLWQHWGRPPIVWYRGGHIGFVRSRPVQRFVRDALTQSGMTPPGKGEAAGAVLL